MGTVNLLTAQSSSFESAGSLEWVGDAGSATWVIDRSNDQAIAGLWSLRATHPDPPLDPAEYFVYFASPEVLFSQTTTDFNGWIYGDSTTPADATLYLLIYDASHTLVTGYSSSVTPVVNGVWTEVGGGGVLPDPSWIYCRLLLTVVGSTALVPFNAGDRYYMDDFHINATGGGWYLGSVVMVVSTPGPI